MALLRGLFVAAAVLFICHVSLFALIGNERERAFADNVFDVVEGILATTALFLAARMSLHISRRLAIAWAVLGAAMLCNTLGDTLWTYIESVLRQDAFPSVADVGYFSYYLLFILGLILLPQVPLTRNERNQFFLDLAIVVVASAMLFGRFLFAPLFADPTVTGPQLFFALMYPVLDLVLIWGTVSIVLRRTEWPGPLLALAFGALALGIADTLFNYETVTNTYQNRSIFTEMAFALHPLLAVLAGTLQMALVHARADGETRKPSALSNMLVSLSRLQKSLALALPYIWVCIAFVLTVIEVSRPHTDGIDADFILDVAGLGCTIVLVLIRQALAMRQNAQLSSRLARLVDASRVLAEPLNSNDMPALILGQVGRLIEYDVACIVLLEPANTGTLYRCTHAALDEATEATEAEPELIDMPMPITSMMQAGLAMVLTPPYLGWHRNLVHWLSPHASTSLETLGTALIMPMVVDQRSVGLLAVGHAKVDHYSLADLDVLTSFAHQAGATLENARLRRQEVAAAAQAERSRLARELHDSVSQALFGITLGARTTRELISRDAPRAVDAVDYVLNLADGAQAEMRALIFELRPEMLATEGLIEALRKQSDALCKRHSLSVTFDADCPEPDIPLHMKEALYRIAMEAIQNTIRHAHATHVDIALECDDAARVGLMVRDDGRGFDPHATHIGHFGLHSMRERATHIGATLNVTSAIGAGSTTRVSLPLA